MQDGIIIERACEREHTPGGFCTHTLGLDIKRYKVKSKKKGRKTAGLAVNTI